MNFGKRVSLKEIIEGVYINSGVQNIDYTDSLFHTIRLMGIIGIPEVYIDKITDGNAGNFEPVEITNYKGILPADMVGTPDGVRDYDTKVVFNYSTDTFHLNSKQPTQKVVFEPAYPIIDYTEFQAITVDDIGSDEFVNQRFLAFKDQFEGEVLRNIEIHNVNTNSQTQYMRTYKIQDNSILCNIKECRIEIAYKGILTDEDGYPTIPDDEYFKRALETFLQERLDYKLWRTGKITDSVYKDSQQKYCWNIASAKSHCSIPSIDEMQSLSNAWLRLVPDLRSHESGFINNSRPERIWRH